MLFYYGILKKVMNRHRDNFNTAQFRALLEQGILPSGMGSCPCAGGAGQNSQVHAPSNTQAMGTHQLRLTCTTGARKCRHGVHHGEYANAVCPGVRPCRGFGMLTQALLGEHTHCPMHRQIQCQHPCDAPRESV